MNLFRSPGVILVLILLVLLLFGSRRLPEVARSVGESLKVFKKEVKDLRDDDVPAEQTRPAATTATDPAIGTAAAPGGPVPPSTGTASGPSIVPPPALPTDATTTPQVQRPSEPNQPQG